MRIAVLGASGLVGRTMVRLLETSTWLAGPPVLLTSARSVGTAIPWREGEVICQEVAPNLFDDIDVALFSAGSGPARQWGPVAAGRGAWVIDNSGAFRMEPDVPLVVPEINGSLVDGGGDQGGIIANPNCSTIQVAMALAPLERLAGLAEVQVTTLQAVSGAGLQAVTELKRQNADRSADPDTTVFPRPMAGNVIPAIGPPLGDGSFEEEAKVERDLRKILGRGDDLAVTCTAIRVPVIDGHSAAVRVVLQRDADLPAILAALAAWPGLEVAADPHDYLTPREMAGRTEVHAGRVRRDPNHSRAVLLWVVADNLLKGAAWNAVQIAARLADGRTA